MTSISTRSSATLALEGVLSDLLVDLIFKSRFRSFFFTLWFNFKSYVLTSAGRRGGGFTARSPPGLPVVQTAQGDPGPGGEAHATSGPCRVSVGWHRRGVEAALGRGCVSPGRASEDDSLAQEDMPPSEFRGLRVASQP